MKPRRVEPKVSTLRLANPYPTHMSLYHLQPYRHHYTALLRLGFPIIVGQLGTIAVGFADTLMIGRYGTPELAASSFVNNLFTLVILFGMGFSYGLTPIVGALEGRREQAEAGHALRAGLVANLIMALLLSAVMTVAYFCLDRMGQPQELMPLIRPYFLLQLASLVPVMLFNGFKQFADGITCTSLSMYILLTSNVCNIAGNYLFIFGHCGFPEWGLFGAGFSTLLARSLTPLLFIIVLTGQSRFRRYRVGFFRAKGSRTLFRRLWSLGLPVGLQIGMESAAFSLSAVMVGWLGTLALASHQVMITISQLAYMVYYGIGAALSIRISHFHGQGDDAESNRAATAGFHIMLMAEAVMCLSTFFLRHQLCGWFSDDVAITTLVPTLFLPFLLYQFGDGLQICFSNALRGVSDVKPMMWFAFIAYFVVSLPLGYLFGFVFHGGLYGLWMAFPFGLTTAGVLFWHRFRQHGRPCVSSSSRAAKS